MSNEVALQQANDKMKIRIYDLQEALQSERDSFGQFINVLAQVLELDGEDATKLQAYVDAVVELKQQQAQYDPTQPEDGEKAE